MRDETADRRQNEFMPPRNRRIILGASAVLLAAASGAMFVAPATLAANANSLIRRVDFRNEPWDLGDGVIAEMKDGEWETGSIDGGDRRSFQIVDVDHGDIDGDANEEAIVTTNENTGGTGQFSDAVVFRWTGKGPVRVTSHGVGDRSDGGIFNVVIVGGVARIDRFTNGEGACCPTEVSTYSVKLRGNKLITAKPTTTRAYIVLSAAPEAPTIISFLRGGTSAAIEGSAGARGTIDARRGQILAIAVAKSRYGIVSKAVTLKQGSTVLATVSAGGVTKVSLPVTGRYTLQVVGSDPAGYSSAELSIR